MTLTDALTNVATLRNSLMPALLPKTSRAHSTCIFRVVIPLTLALLTGLAHADPEPDLATAIGSPAIGAGSFGTSVAMLDFDGDGTLELAAGDISETPMGGSAQGIVHIFRNTAQGWQVNWSYELQNASALFGAVLAVGDFDEDGRYDLLVGAPGLNSGGGGVYLIRHTAPNSTTNAAIISNFGAGGGACGSSLAVGDFDNDDHLDFATGCPLASFDAFTSVGRVERGYGNGAGTFELGFLSQQTAGIGGAAETGDGFGAALAAGDFDCDGISDLAIGVPNESVDGGTQTGAVHMLLGALGSGLSGAGSQLWHQGVAGVPGVSGNGDHFGAALAAADFDGSLINACDDLAIGIPDDLENEGGAVVVLSGSPAGLVSTDAELITRLDFPQDAVAHPGAETPSNNHRFGATLVAAQLGRGSAADLVIGAEGWTPVSLPPNPIPPQPGIACIAYATSTSILGNGQQCISGRQFDAAAAEDIHFGLALAVGAIDSAPDQNLVIGSPGSNQMFLLGNTLFRDGFEGSAD